MEDGGVEVVDMDRILDNVVTKIVGLSMDDARFTLVKLGGEKFGTSSLAVPLEV